MVAWYTNNLHAAGLTEEVGLSLLNLALIFHIQRGKKGGKNPKMLEPKAVQICAVSRHTMCEKQMDSFGPRENLRTVPCPPMNPLEDGLLIYS